MLRLSIIVYVCSALSHVLSTPALNHMRLHPPAPNLHMTYAPMADAAQTKLLDFTPEVHPEHVQEFMVMNNGEIRQRRGKLPEEALPPGVATHAPNRELLEVTTMTVAPTSVTMHRDFQTRIASPEEQAWIDKFVETHNQGRPYRMTGKNQFTEMPKENCDHDYFCGRMRFFDEDGKMIHETPCCYWNVSCLSVREINSAELGLAIASIIGCPIATVAAAAAGFGIVLGVAVVGEFFIKNRCLTSYCHCGSLCNHVGDGITSGLQSTGQWFSASSRAALDSVGQCVGKLCPSKETKPTTQMAQPEPTNLPAGLSAGQGASNMPGVPSGHDPEAGFSHFFHPESTFSGHGAEEYWGPDYYVGRPTSQIPSYQRPRK
ncbi:hypothetical protein Pst134EB_026501 [Puccinia striiformis f. sp. tritici]|nr:hypothetical protein Pst134EB_026501 [Puccinia striiformis f. sp. tritici]